MKKQRLDQALVARGLCDSREQAKRLILAGEVVVENMSMSGPPKPGMNVTEDAEIRVKSKPKYVGRGGLKLEKALDEFEIDPAGKVVFDIGASTGGFTDCCLQREAKHVYAYDVGTNQLAWKLRDDERVTSREGVNVRHLDPADFPEKVDLVVIDVSFISLTLILPVAFSVMKPEADLICLIKPQFELKREQIGKGGIVREPELHDEAVEKIRRFVEGETEGVEWRGLVESPIQGTDGNVEFLAWLKLSA
ncbi:MAG: TlyA family RNA methyltransferase [Verrucomicrobiales bacterium]|nr:TlyA family RNA methyltransferase [Verrucomicrobiales bacterium]